MTLRLHETNEKYFYIKYVENFCHQKFEVWLTQICRAEYVQFWTFDCRMRYWWSTTRSPSPWPPWRVCRAVWTRWENTPSLGRCLWLPVPELIFSSTSSFLLEPAVVSGEDNCLYRWLVPLIFNNNLNYENIFPGWSCLYLCWRQTE